MHSIWRSFRPVVVVLLVLTGLLSTSTLALGATAQLNVSKAEKTITTNWQNFFSGKSSAKVKIALLQDGSKFSSIIDAQAKTSLAKSTSAVVSKVTDVKSTSATVTYSIKLSGKTALSNTTGTAVYTGGTWKVSDSAFCALLDLEGTKTSACPSAK